MKMGTYNKGKCALVAKKGGSDQMLIAAFIECEGGTYLS